MIFGAKCLKRKFIAKNSISKNEISFTYLNLSCNSDYSIVLGQELPGSSDGKESACNVKDLGLIPGLGRSPGGGHGNPLQDSCLKNSMEIVAWQAMVHMVTKSWT